MSDGTLRDTIFYQSYSFWLSDLRFLFFSVLFWLVSSGRGSVARDDITYLHHTVNQSGFSNIWLKIWWQLMSCLVTVNKIWSIQTHAVPMRQISWVFLCVLINNAWRYFFILLFIVRYMSWMFSVKCLTFKTAKNNRLEKQLNLKLLLF